MQSVSKPAAQDNSNDSRDNKSPGDNLEDDAEETPEREAEPVVCPPGDLFSATTGEACTATSETNLLTTVSAPVANQATNNSSASTETPAVLQTQEFQEPADSLPAADTNVSEITPDMLTALSANALPTETIPPSIPVVLGIVSGLVLLYAALKFLIL